MIINHNISALNTHRQLSANNNAVQGSLEKLSSGLQINRAGDDAAGLAISEKMRGQIRGLDMATKNAQDGISLIQTAEGALNETHEILQRMRELAVQSSNDTNTDSDRAELQKEVDQLANALTDISKDTQFNEKDLLTGDFAEQGLTFHVGANQGQSLTVKINNMGASELSVAQDYTVNQDGSIDGLEYREAQTAQDSQGYVASTVTGEDGDPNTNIITLDNGTVATYVEDEGYYDGDDLILATENVLDDGAGTIAAQDAVQAGYYNGENLEAVADKMFDEGSVTVGINITNQTNADASITTIQSAIDNVSAERSKLGAVQNRLEHTINNLGTSSENLTAAESRIRDVDHTEAA